MKNSYVDFTNLTFTKFMKNITFVLSKQTMDFTMKQSLLFIFLILNLNGGFSVNLHAADIKSPAMAKPFETPPIFSLATKKSAALEVLLEATMVNPIEPTIIMKNRKIPIRSILPVFALSSERLARA